MHHTHCDCAKSLGVNMSHFDPVRPGIYLSTAPEPWF
jgi:hypothetical protein